MNPWNGLIAWVGTGGLETVKGLIGVNSFREYAGPDEA